MSRTVRFNESDEIRPDAPIGVLPYETPPESIEFIDQGGMIMHAKANTHVRRSLVGAAVTLALAGPALAQTTTPGTPPDTGLEQVEEVVVTGSRIRRSNASSPIPLQVFNVGDLEASGTDDLAEALQQLPGVSPAVSPQGSNNSIQTSGLSTISLRRLGDDRTLVLINGKRAVSNSGNADRVSLSTLPVGFIKRTEVTTGGASAIYGSDAIAGVANFIIEDDFEGVRLETRYSYPDASGGDESRIDGLFGTKFNDDRGYLLFGVSHRDEKVIRADSSRPLSVRNLEFDDPSTSSGDDFANERSFPGCDGPNEEKHCLLPSFDDDTPGGVFEDDAWFKDGRWFNDRDLNPGDRADGRDFFADFDGHPFREGLTLSGARELNNFALNTSYQITPRMTGTVTAMYSDIKTATYGGFETLDNGDAIGLLTALDPQTLGNIPSDNPFIPPEVEITRSGSVSFDRLTVELGEQARFNDRTTTRVMADLTGEFGESFIWNTYYTYGEFRQKQRNPNEVNFQNAQFAFRVDPNDPTQCEDPVARQNGCVPLNIFGEGTMTPEMANYIRYNGRASQTRHQQTVGAYVSGDAFEIPAGPVKAVLGAEWRREEQDTFGDPDGDQIGGIDGDPSTPDFNVTSLAVFPSVSADYEVVELFTELDVPITDSINLALAGRFADYDTVGSISSFNAGSVWQVSDSFRFRGQYSRSQRAPSITEFFSPPRQDADSLEDACNGLEFDAGTGLFDASGINELSGSGGENADLAIVRANCTNFDVGLNAGIEEWLRDPDNAGDEFDGNSGVQGPNAGAQIINGVRQLQEETADTYTFGFAYVSQAVPGLSVVSDYYRIEISDNIDSVSTQDLVDLCYSSADFPNNRFCDVVTRNPNTGDVVEVINYQANLDNVTVEGIDLSVLYELEFGNHEYDLDFRFTHYLTDETTFVGINDTTITNVALGEIENGEDEFRLRLGYRYGDFRTTYTINYLSGGIDDINSDANPDDDRYFRVGGEAWHRLYLSYAFGDDDQYRVFGGVNNLTNNFGPFMPTGLDYGSSRNIVSDMNDSVGRELFFGARVRF